MIASKYIEFVLVIAGSLLAIYIGSHIVTLPLPFLFISLAAVLIILWGLTAGNFWWLPMLTGGTILGVFKIGVKISPVEVAFILGIVGLAPLLLVRGEKALQQGRKALPLVFYLTALYILVRLMIDVIPASGNRGNLGRILFDAIWPFVFGFLFHHYGSLQAARAAILFMFVALSIRCAAAIAGYLLSIPLYIPGINYVLSFSGSDSLIPMRTVAASLLMVSFLLFHASRHFLVRLFLIIASLCAATLVVMGASRFSTFMMFFLPIAYFSWSRRWLPVILAGCVAVGLVGFINVFPNSLEALPPVAERSLTGLIIGHDESGIHEATSSSDEWHEALKVEGFNRWSQSPATVLFGYGIRPSPDLYDMKSFSEDPKAVVALAANTGAYECGFWCMTALFGVVGFGLYTLVFLHFWKQTFPFLFRRPVGTIWEGILFWGCYTSVIWYVSCYFSGTTPNMELFLMILAIDVIQDGKLERDNEPDPAPARPGVPALRLSPEYARLQS